MTNEEALDELNVIYERLSHPEDCEQGVYSFRDGDYLEALDMAIKALEQEPAEWIVDTDDTRRWDRVRFYCSACDGWNTYGKSKYCPNCGRRMQSDRE